MSLGTAARIARREMRGGLRGHVVFLMCLMLGVAAISAVGTVRAAIEAALAEQGAVLLGGDAELSFTYRFADDEERAFMRSRARAVSEIVDFRSMAVRGSGDAAERALTQVKAVDDAYPLTGAVVLDPDIPLAAALAVADGLPGAVMDPVLADRLGLRVGDRFRLGAAEFRLAARLVREPDAATAGFTLGPRTIVRTADLAGSGLIQPGSLFDTRYRLLLPAGTDLGALQAQAEAAFLDHGLRWRDSRNGAPGIQRFVDRMGSFLVLVGLAGMAVGGVGIASAVHSYLDGKRENIAILKSLGAESATIFAVYLVQVAALTLAGIAAGLLLGGGLPVLAGPWIAAALPIPIRISVAAGPLLEAALYGALTAALFALWPLARSRDVRAAALFRDIDAARLSRPGWRLMAVLATLAAALAASAVAFSGVPRLAWGTLGGIAAALTLLWGAAWLLRRLA
ncbi:ABC transporter permease, partial [Albidovulum sp.]